MAIVDEEGIDPLEAALFTSKGSPCHLCESESIQRRKASRLPENTAGVGTLESDCTSSV